MFSYQQHRQTNNNYIDRADLQLATDWAWRQQQRLP